MQMHYIQYHRKNLQHFGMIFYQYQMPFGLDLVAVTTNNASGSFHFSGLSPPGTPNK